MKISIDLDGTLYSHMGFFRNLMISMQSHGHKVGILTGHNDKSKNHVYSTLKRLNFPTPDFYLGRTEKYMPLNGAHYKSDMILEHKIDIHFDDFDYDNVETKRIFDSKSIRNHIVKKEWKEPKGSKQE